jgi:hypothetical protein
VPVASVWLIRVSFVHFASGALLGAFYLSWKAVGWFAWVVSHRQVHVEQMLVGWMVQLVIGVAFWILPRTEATATARSGPSIWVVFALLNAGVLLAALGTAPDWPRELALAGRSAEIVAAGLFAAHAWNRQRPYTRGVRRMLV